VPQHPRNRDPRRPVDAQNQPTGGLELRAQRHAALGDPRRLEIVDLLTTSDRSPGDLERAVGVSSSLLAHHLDVLEAVGLVCRTRSSGDGRRRYVHLCAEGFAELTPGGTVPLGRSSGRTVFVCTANSARSQLAAAILGRRTGHTALSAGTRPAGEVHPGARAAARRLGLDLDGAVPHHLGDVRGQIDVVVTVCDQANETLRLPDGWGRAARLHWSIPDPVTDDRPSAFDDVARELERRVDRVMSAPATGATA